MARAKTSGKTPAQLVEDALDLKSLPEVYQLLDKEIGAPNSTAASIADIVSRDPGLTVRLLGLVNSSFLGFPGKIETISQAVTVVGTAQLRDLALATSVIQMFRGIPERMVDMGSFWRHSLACAVSARVLARQRGESNVERLFVAGLLHDIGSMIVYLREPRAARSCLEHCERTGGLLHATEGQVLGFDHADVGRALLTAWNLPSSHQEAVGCHHRPSRAGRFPMEAAVVHVADIMAHVLDVGSSGEKLIPPLEAKAWDLLELSPEIVPELMEKVEKQYSSAAGYILWNL